jgi:hypothetical protein
MGLAPDRAFLFPPGQQEPGTQAGRDDHDEDS